MIGDTMATVEKAGKDRVARKRAKRVPGKGRAKARGRGASAVVAAAKRGEAATAGGMRNPLANPRYEQFCQFVVSGVMPRVAAVRCGYSQRCASTQAWRLLSHVEICRRLAWLNSECARRVIARKRDVLAAHTADALTGIADFTPLIGMDRDQAHAFLSEHPYGHVVRELEIENVEMQVFDGDDDKTVSRIESRVKRFKLADSVRARAELAKLLDWYPSPHGMRVGAGGSAAGGSETPGSGSAYAVQVICETNAESPAAGEGDCADGDAPCAGQDAPQRALLARRAC